MTVVCAVWLSHILSLCVCLFVWILHTYLSLRTWHRFFGSYFGREWNSSKEWERGKINSFWLDRQANDVFLSKEGTQGGPACCQHLWTSKDDFQSCFTGTQGMSQDLNFSFLWWKRSFKNEIVIVLELPWTLNKFLPDDGELRSYHTRPFSGIKHQCAIQSSA